MEKYLHITPATSKGHLNQKRKSTHSTTQQFTSVDINTKGLGTMHKIIELTHKVYTDQTGHFPVTSSQGNKYIMILLHCDTNCILAQPMKSRTEEHMVKAFSTMHNTIKQHGYTISSHMLDNEAPPLLI